MRSLSESDYNSGTVVDPSESAVTAVVDEVKKMGFFKALFNKQSTSERVVNGLFQAFLGVFAIIPLFIYWGFQYSKWKNDEDMHYFSLEKSDKKPEEGEGTTSNEVEIKASDDTQGDTSANDESVVDNTASEVDSVSVNKSNVEHSEDPKFGLKNAKQEAIKAVRKNVTGLDYDIKAAIKNSKDPSAQIEIRLEPQIMGLANIMEKADVKSSYKALRIQRGKNIEKLLEKKFDISFDKETGNVEKTINNKATTKRPNAYSHFKIFGLPAEVIAYYKNDKIVPEDPHAFSNEKELFNVWIDIAINEKGADTDTLSINLWPEALNDNSYFYFVKEFVAKIDDKQDFFDKTFELLGKNFQKHLGDIVKSDIKVEKGTYNLTKEQTTTLLKSLGKENTEIKNVDNENSETDEVGTASSVSTVSQ